MKEIGKIFFGTKDENNARRENEFISLSPSQRLELFFQMMDEDAKCYSGERIDKNPTNLILVKK